MPPKKKSALRRWPKREMRLADLTPHPSNAREMGEAERSALRASLAEFGVVEDLVFNEKTGYLVGGHRRRELMLEAGDETAEVIVVSLGEDKEAALRLVLNNPKAQGRYTRDINDVLEELERATPDLYASLNLDALHMPEPEPLKVYEVPTSTISVQFTMTVRGPLPTQPDALERIREALEKLEGVEVDVVTNVL